MELNFIDYFLIGIVALVAPVWGVVDYRRFLRKIAAGVPDVRVRYYRSVITEEWVATVAIVIAWLVGGRGLAALGLGLESGVGFWVGVGLTLAVLVLLIVQAITVTGSREKLDEAKAAFTDLQEFLPRGAREGNWWKAVSITAGICEEVIYRGFLITVLTVPFGIWPAVLLSTVAFGLIHSYQGPKGILKTGVAGLILAGLFVLTGSLWASIALHIVMDLTSGHIGRKAIEPTVDEATVAA